MVIKFVKKINIKLKRKDWIKSVLKSLMALPILITLYIETELASFRALWLHLLFLMVYHKSYINNMPDVILYLNLSNISSDLPRKRRISNLQLCLSNLWLKLYISGFLYSIQEINTLSSQSSMISERFKGYRCESGILTSL